MYKSLHKIHLFCIVLITGLLLTSCIKFKKMDARQTPVNALERAKLNVKEGKGMSLKGMMGNKSTTYEFSTSNPMWRASLEILDFIPLVTVDYSGGIIITDWYSDQANSKDSIKITLRFLSNEIQSGNLKIIVHQRKCDQNNNCSTRIIDSEIKRELSTSIIRQAAIFAKQTKEKKK
jgi:hypothetical protein